MSERSEAIEAAVDREWLTTAEIVERAGYSQDPAARSCAVQRLAALRKQGRVESRPVHGAPERKGVVTYQWRLRP